MKVEAVSRDTTGGGEEGSSILFHRMFLRADQGSPL